MQDMMAKLVDLPLARMFVLAGIVFLLVAVMGRIEGKVEPGHAGRIGASIVGVLLMALGLAMYFLDGDAVRDALREGARPPLALRAAPPGLPIKVVTGSYGQNCGAPAGNVTATLSRACDGRSVCSVALEAGPAEGAAPGCARDYIAEWKCGAGAGVYSATIPAAAGHAASVTLACPGNG